MVAIDTEFTTASGSFDTSTTNATTSAETDFIVNWIDLVDSLEITYVDEKEFINELHVVEHRKDLFRVASIIPNSHNYKQKIITNNIFSSRNLKGKQARRL